MYGRDEFKTSIWVVALVMFVVLSLCALALAFGGSGVDKGRVVTFLQREGLSDSEIIKIMDHPNFPALSNDALLPGPQLWVRGDYRQAVLFSFFEDSCCTVRILYDYTETTK